MKRGNSVNPAVKKQRSSHSPTAIFTSDWHLREDTPLCRTDDFQQAQWNKVKYIQQTAKAYNCPVLHAGDLFEHWKPSPALLSKTIQYLPEDFYTIYGNHDLPQHSLELKEKTGVYTLITAGKVKELSGTHWGQPIDPKGSFFFPGIDRTVLVVHDMTWKGKAPWPGVEGMPAKEVLNTFFMAAIILVGHNHHRFTEEIKGRYLINPGSLTRQNADQGNHHPAIYLWYSKDNSIEEVPLPIEKNVISREYLERKEERDSRISAFISRLNEEWQTGLSFEDNLERFFQANKVHISVQSIIRKAVDANND